MRPSAWIPMRIFLYRDDYAGGDGIPFGKLLNFRYFL